MSKPDKLQTFTIPGHHMVHRGSDRSLVTKSFPAIENALDTLSIEDLNKRFREYAEGLQKHQEHQNPVISNLARDGIAGIETALTLFQELIDLRQLLIQPGQ